MSAFLPPLSQRTDTFTPSTNTSGFGTFTLTTSVPYGVFTRSTPPTHNPRRPSSSTPAALPCQRRRAGQQVVQRTPEAVEVGAVVGMGRVQRLLRGHVVRRTQHGPVVGEARVLVLGARHLGQAEVQDLDDVACTLARAD